LTRRTHRAGPDNHVDCARSASDDYCTPDLSSDHDCGRASDHISTDHDLADDNGAHGLNNDAARSEWVVAKRTSGKDLWQCVLAERTGYRPGCAIVVPAGNNSSLDLRQADRTYWFAPGVHTLGTGQYDQIIPSDNSTYIGGPGAILDGQGKNQYAFTQHARNVTVKYLTVRNFVAPMNEGTVDHDYGENWTMQYNTVSNNGGAGIFVGAANVASYNCLKDNSQYGFQAYGADGGESNIVLDHNEIVGNNTPATGNPRSTAVAAPAVASSGMSAMFVSPTTTSMTTRASACGQTRMTTTSCSTATGSRTTTGKRSSGRSATTPPFATM
jgi:hypothetical protein